MSLVHRTVRYLMAGSCLTLLGSCSRPVETGEASPVILSVISAGSYNRASEEAAVRRFCEKYPDIQVKLIEAPGRDYYVKALAMMAAGNELDILWMGSGFGLFAWRDALMPLDPFIRSDPDFPIGSYDSTVVDWYRHKGALLGIPYGIDIQAIALNKAAFIAAGVPLPSRDWTYDDFVQSAKKISDFGVANPAACRFGAGVDKIAPYYFGLSMVNEEGTKSGLTGAQANLWLNENINLLRDSRVFARVGAQGTLDRLSEFLQGRVAMVEVYTWDIGELRDRARFPWTLAVNPIAKTGERAGWASSSGFSISARTKHPREAWELLKELVGDETQRMLLSTTIPARVDLQPEYLQMNGLSEQNLNALLEMLPYMKTPARIPELLEISQELDYWFELALQKNSTSEDIVPKLEQSINKILSTSPARQ